MEEEVLEEESLTRDEDFSYPEISKNYPEPPRHNNFMSSPKQLRSQSSPSLIHSNNPSIETVFFTNNNARNSPQQLPHNDRNNRSPVPPPLPASLSELLPENNSRSPKNDRGRKSPSIEIAKRHTESIGTSPVTHQLQDDTKTTLETLSHQLLTLSSVGTLQSSSK